MAIRAAKLKVHEENGLKFDPVSADEFHIQNYKN